MNATWGNITIKIRHNQSYQYPYAPDRLQSSMLLPGEGHDEVIQEGGEERQRISFDSYVSSYAEYKTLYEAWKNREVKALTAPGVEDWYCLISPLSPASYVIGDHITFSITFVEEDEPEVILIEVYGDNVIFIPSEGDVTEEYTAVVRDQNGNVMAEEEVTWSVEDVDGTDVDSGNVSINQEGVVTVSSTATAQEDSFKVIATSDTDGTVTGEIVVSLESE